MADWPDTVELKQVLDVDIETDNWTLTLDRVRAAAIWHAKALVGDWDDAVDEPDDALAQMALRVAEIVSERPTVTTGELARDVVVQLLLMGHRRRFAIA